MHHLVIDVRPEEESRIEIYDPFVDEVIGSKSDSKKISNSLQKQEQQQQKQEYLLEEEIPEMKQKKNTNLISSYNLNPIHASTYFFKDPQYMLNRQIEESMRLPIVYIFALPCEFDHVAFLTELLGERNGEEAKKFTSSLQHIRVIMDYSNDSSDNGEKQLENKMLKKKKSIVLYFSERDIAEMFTQKFNCTPIDTRGEEFMFIVSLRSLTFVLEQDRLKHALESHQEMNLTELPNCPTCIEKLEPPASGFLLSQVMNLPFYDEPDRWKQAKNACRTCTPHSEQSHCYLCEEKEGLWICLVCGHNGCGRYKKGHAKDHWYTSGHCLSMDVQSERIWDYSNDTFVHRTMKTDNKKTIIVNAQSYGRSEDSMMETQCRGNSHINLWHQFEESKSDEKSCSSSYSNCFNSTGGVGSGGLASAFDVGGSVENAIWEYCYVMSHQMEEQSIYFEKKIEEVQKQNAKVISNLKEDLAEVQKAKEELVAKKLDIIKSKEAILKKNAVIESKNAAMNESIERSNLFIPRISANVQELQAKKPKLEMSSQLSEDIQKSTLKLQMLEAHLAELYEQLSQQ